MLCFSEKSKVLFNKSSVDVGSTNQAGMTMELIVRGDQQQHLCLLEESKSFEISDWVELKLCLQHCKLRQSARRDSF